MYAVLNALRALEEKRYETQIDSELKEWIHSLLGSDLEIALCAFVAAAARIPE